VTGQFGAGQFGASQFGGGLGKVWRLCAKLTDAKLRLARTGPARGGDAGYHGLKARPPLPTLPPRRGE